MNTETAVTVREELQGVVTNELGRIDALFAGADLSGMAVDKQAVEALVSANELYGLLGELQNQVSGIRQQINERLTELFIMLGVQSMNVDGSTVYKNIEKFANAKPDCRQQLVAWAQEHELVDMIVVQPARFKSWCREQIEAGTFPAEIADFVDIFEKSTLRIRRS